MEIIMLFMPSFIGLNLYLHIKKDLKNVNIFSIYGLINILTNLIVLLYLYIIKDYKSVSFMDIANNIAFNIKYIIISSVISIVVGYILYIIEKNICINVYVEPKKKK